MKVTYQSDKYSPDKVLKRYVQRIGDEYRFCEVGQNRRYDIRQGIVDETELPETVKTAADARSGYFPSHVEWPL
jgi:capsid portal protein